MKRILLFLVLATAIQMCSAQNRTFRGDVTVKGDLYLSSSSLLSESAHVITDTLTFPGGWGDGLDSTGCNVGAKLGTLPVVQDSVILDSTKVRCTGTDGDVTVQWKYGDWGTAGTGLHTAINVTTAGGWVGTSTFTTQVVERGNEIWGIITEKSYGCTAIRFILYYHEARY